MASPARNSGRYSGEQLNPDFESFPGRDCHALPQELTPSRNEVIRLAFSAQAYLSLLHTWHQPLILQLSHSECCDDQHGTMNNVFLLHLGSDQVWTNQLAPVQVPDEVLQQITSNLLATDLAHLRLTCKQMRASQPAIQDGARLYLAYSPNWTTAAAEIRRLLPAATVVLKMAADCNVSLTFPFLWDVVSITSRPGIIPRWSAVAVTQTMMATKIKPSIVELDKVKALLNQLEGKADVELALQVKSSYLSIPDNVRDPENCGQKTYKASMQALASLVTQLDSVDNLPDTLKHDLNLCFVTRLAFALPSNARHVERYKEALKQLPGLREVSMLTKFSSSHDHISAVLEVLPILSHINALRIATCSEFQVAASVLQHVTMLELGRAVYCELPPTTLKSLSLLDLQDEPARHTFWQELYCQKSLFCLSLNSYMQSSLCHLPAHLHNLTLTQHFEEEGLQLVKNALGELMGLRVLRIGNFLTSSVVGMLSQLHLPYLHTFGFHVHHHGTGGSRPINKMFDLQSAHLSSELNGVLEPYNMWSKRKPRVLKPPDTVIGLAIAFPVLMLMEVSLGAVEEQELDSNFAPQLKLDCDFLSQDNFAHLRGITCQFQNIPLYLRAVPSSCYVVYKTPAVH